MSLAPHVCDELLAARSLADLRALLDGAPTPSLPQVQELTTRARALAAAPRTARLAVVHTFTSELLQPWLDLAAAVQELELATYHAPYGLALQEAEPGSPLLAHAPDLTWLLLQRTDLHPAFARPVSAIAAGERAAVRAEALARLTEIVGAFRSQAVGHLLVSLLPEPAAPELGLHDASSESSSQRWWAALDAEIADWMRRAAPASSLLDLNDVLREVGRRRFFDLRYWHSARYPFTAEAALEVARRLAAYLAVLKTPRAKVIVLDADNTLWGGVIGEDGIDGIALGPDHPGSAFVAFQRRMLDFQQRGFVLAMCSKNNLADVEEVLRRHPHQVLRDQHFAALRVNWEPKPRNLAALAKELNLGLDSFVFVDDSDHECAAVREALPQVEVIQVPKRAVDVPACLDHVARLEVLSLTAEDRAKTALYAQERQRQELLRGAVGDAGGDRAFLERLGMRMRIRLQPLPHLARLAQLTQKTNQFNLTTRRYDEKRMRVFIESDDVLVADFSLEDVYGDSGIVGLAIVRVDGKQACLDTFLMSCRVIGRCAGEAFLEAVLRTLHARGVCTLSAEYLPTAKNQLVENFLPAQRFTASGGTGWQRDLRNTPPAAESEFPIAIDWPHAQTIGA